MTAHKHAAAMAQYAQDAAETEHPELRWQFKAADGRWENCRLVPIFDGHIEYRRKPRTITYTVTIPEPLREAPEMGTKFWVPAPWDQDFVHAEFWEGHGFALRWLHRGLCFATKEDAIAAAKAMLPFKQEEKRSNRKSNWRSIMKLCFSTDDENFVHDDVGSLLDDLMCNGELYVGREYYEADCEKIEPSCFLAGRRIDCVLDQLDEMLWDEFVGEAAGNDFTAATDEAKEELRQLLTAWITKHVNVSQYWKVVGKSRRREVTLEDVLLAESTGSEA